jgi:biotin/methionine sulfoxide reductase
VSWEQALTLVADELTRVKREQGNAAIYGGSYGWSSAGRFHHAQSQLHRFLNLFGGYTGSTNTYSIAAGERILPHILGDLDTYNASTPTGRYWRSTANCLSPSAALPLRNAQVNGGGANDHALQHWLQTLRRNGTRFINISPVQNDLSAVPDADWLAVKPGGDTALLLALCQVLIADALYDQAFVDSHTVGFAPYRDYLFGRDDGVVKARNGPSPEPDSLPG